MKLGLKVDLRIYILNFDLVCTQSYKAYQKYHGLYSKASRYVASWCAALQICSFDKGQTVLSLHFEMIVQDPRQKTL